MNAVIITIGDEILIGQITDTNSVWLAQQLTLAGITVREMASIRDDEYSITSALDRYIEKTDLILITGGLGPTKDDLTKETLAEYFETELVTNEEVLDEIKGFFSKRGRDLIESNRRQAMVPGNCRILKNVHGTAPGMWFTSKGTQVISMPGVPYEMKPMVTEQLMPALAEKLGVPEIVHRTIMTEGVPESYLAEIIHNWEEELPSCVKLAYLPRPGIVRLRLSVTGDCTGNAGDLLDELTIKLRKRIGDHIFAYDDILIEKVIGEILVEKKMSVATAESCTGGNIAHLMTSIPGSSRYFKGSVIAYNNEIKESILGIDPAIIDKHGAVSKDAVEAMARGVMKITGSDTAMATSGIAGPDGGTEQKPVGTVWIAVAAGDKVISKMFQFGGTRSLVIEQSSIKSIGMLRKLVLGIEVK